MLAFGKRGRAAYLRRRSLGGNPGFMVHTGVRAVLLDHLVIDSQQKERGGPLADEQGMRVPGNLLSK